LRCWPPSVALGLLLVAALPVEGEAAGSVNLPINDPRTDKFEGVTMDRGLADRLSKQLGIAPEDLMP
jgi:hypothetical protein